jgi:hypothetical protein
MQYLDAYHMSSSDSQSDRNERILADKTCFDCGYVDETANGHYCTAERYNTAHARLQHLIDHPDKAVSVAEYRAQIKAAQKAVKVAHKAWTGEK